MYRKILVPVVIPSNVSPLIRMASYLLEPEGEIHVLHVITEKSLPQVAKGWRSSLHLVIPAHETGAALDVRVTPEVAVAPDAAVEILEKAETLGCDAILMTIDGSAGHRRKLFGHTCTAILNHATTDVVVVNPLALTSGKASKIIIPTFTLNPPAKASLAAEAIASRIGNVPIVTLHIREGTGRKGMEEEDHEFKGNRPRIHRSLKTVLFPSRLFRPNSDMPDAIMGVVRYEGYGICVVGEEGRGSGAPMINRNFMEKLFSIAPCPVMVIHG